VFAQRLRSNWSLIQELESMGITDEEDIPDNVNIEGEDGDNDDGEEGDENGDSYEMTTMTIMMVMIMKTMDSKTLLKILVKIMSIYH